MKNRWICILCSAVLLHTACDRQEVMTEVGSNETPVSFAVGTRTEVNSTYTILAYGTDYSYKKFGTYYLKDAAAGILTPCTVDANGAPTESEEQAIKGGWGTVYLSYVSPAMIGYSEAEKGWLTFDPNQEFYCLPATTKNVPGYGTVKFDDNNDQVNDVAMQDVRAKLTVHFYAGKTEGGASTMFSIQGNAVYIKGAGDTGTPVAYYPPTRQIQVNTTTGNEAGKGRKCTVTDKGQNGENGTTTYEDVSGKGQWVYSTDAIPLPAAFYAPKADIESALELIKSNGYIKEGGDYLSLHFPLTQGEVTKNIILYLTKPPYTDEKEGKILPELKPMHNYVYHVIVSSNYITVRLTVTGWEETPLDGSIAPIEQNLTIGTWEIVDTDNDASTTDWELKPLENQIIGTNV